jgi:endonuclease G, mitochondrial
VMPNQVISDDTPLDNFKVPPESIERAAGLLFFSSINKQQLRAINGKSV